MATLIHSYEQQYSVLTADITAKIGCLKAEKKDDQDRLSKEILIKFEEANDLLEQLELECRAAGGGGRVPAYRSELTRLRAEHQAAVSNSSMYNIEQDEYDDWSAGNEQQRMLLDNTERLERSGKDLAEGYRLALEAERTGAAVLQDLSGQRETIQRSRARLRETDEQLGRSSRLVKNMMVRALQQRLVLALVLGVLGVLLALAVYLAVS